MAAINLSPETAEGSSRRHLFRYAAENGLIENVDRWMRHHAARNLTSHTYDPEVAQQVFEAAHEFIADVKSLLAALEARND